MFLNFLPFLNNSGKETAALSDFQVPQDFPLFLINQQARKYFELYADQFDLKKFIKFGHQLVNLKELEDGTWKAKISADGNKFEEEFDNVLLGDGHHNFPVIPKMTCTL